MANQKVPPIERLMARVIKASDPPSCWLYTGSLRNGYGQILSNGKNCYTHRLAYEYYVGPIPPGLEIDHLCRVRCCCNPAHLEIVTKAENARRSHPYNNGLKRQQTACGQGHQFDERNTYWYRGCRYCRACHNARCRKHYKTKAITNHNNREAAG